MREVRSLNSTFVVISGIYQILCTGNGHFYIGSSKDIIVRFKTHLNLLKTQKYSDQNICRKPYFQNSFDKYGEYSLQFYILEECSETNLLEREQYYIDILKPKFNTSLIAGKPPKFSELTDEQKFRKVTKQSHSQKLTLSQKNDQFWTDRTAKFKITRVANGYQHSAETLAKMAAIKAEKKAAGLLKRTLESVLRGIETKRQNSGFERAAAKLRGRKNPEHAKRMKERLLAIPKDQRAFKFSGKGINNPSLKPKIKLINTITNNVQEMYGFEWRDVHGMALPHISGIRTGRLKFIRDKSKVKWTLANK